MPQKIVMLPELGEIMLAKRRGTKNIRLSISAAGKIRVSMPMWVPYTAGLSFVKSRSDWISKHLEDRQHVSLANKARIGKSYRLDYKLDPNAKKSRSRINDQTINIISNLPLDSPQVQSIACKAAERALKIEATKLLPPRLKLLAAKHKYSYHGVVIKKMVSRWGSCSSQKVITLNFFLTQLPWEFIDYVLIHELVHTNHLNHSPAFWTEFESVFPNAKQTRRHMEQFRPVINSIA